MKRYFLYGIVCSFFFCSTIYANPPTGYNLDFIASQQTVSGVYAVDSNGWLYYGHYTSGIGFPTRTDRTKGMSNELWVYNPSSGIHTLFYRAADHGGNPRINSASGFAIDSSVSPWRYFIADQSPNGDPWTSGAIWEATDLNDDGDVNDAGETALVTGINEIPSIEGVIYDSTTETLYASDASGTAGSVLVYRLFDLNSDRFFQSGEINGYFHLPSDAFGGKLAFDTQAAHIIYTADSSGRVFKLQDINADLDCDDAFEAIIIADSLNGGFGIAVDPEGDVFVTGSDYGSGTHHLYEIKPGSPVSVTLFDDIASFTGWTGTIVLDSGTEFEPANPSAKLYMNYSTLTWGDPDVFAVYQGRTPDVPALSIGSIIILILSISILFLKRR